MTRHRHRVDKAMPVKERTIKLPKTSRRPEELFAMRQRLEALMADRRRERRSAA